jgi:hypothetical protein
MRLARGGARAYDVWPASVALVGAGLAAIAVGAGRGVETAAVLVVLGAVLVGVCCWRASVYGALLYVAVSGLPALVLHEQRGVMALLKDVLFVGPAYLGFALSVLARRGSPPAPGLPLPLFAALAVLAGVQVFNPALPNRLVGLIGLKLWLGYVPLYLLGYHLVRDAAGAARLFRLVALTALLPAAVGVAQAALLARGHADLVSRLYGPAAAAVTQGFAAFAVGDGLLRRVPGTLPFVTQLFVFLATGVALAEGWRRAVPRGGARLMADVVWLGLMLAGFLTGARLAFVFLPLLVVLVRLCAGGGVIGALAGCAGSLLAAVALLGLEVGALADHLAQVLRAEVRFVVLDGFSRAWSVGWLGLGAGADATAARYAVADPERWQAVDGVWYEGWFVRAWLELGVVGLALLVGGYGAVVAALARRHRRVSAARARAMSGAVLALLIWALLLGLKGQALDLDPLNMSFWLFAGLATRVTEDGGG